MVDPIDVITSSKGMNPTANQVLETHVAYELMEQRNFSLAQRFPYKKDFLEETKSFFGFGEGDEIYVIKKTTLCI